MKNPTKKCLKHLDVVVAISLTSIFFLACANVQHQATFDKNYLPKDDVRIKVAKVINDTGFSFDIDIEQMLANTLEEQLMEENLLNIGTTEPNLFMEGRIIGYKKGSAFKRWMMPGWGATELAIRCELKDDKNNLVGSAISSREIVAGGLYTIGAWETIFKDVANDVAEDLKNQIEARGYVVQPKTQSQEKPKLAAIPKESPIVLVSLRRQPAKISNQTEISGMLLKYGFFEDLRNADGSFVNDFVDNNDGTVTDKATGLMWQRGGSSGALDNQGAKNYIEQLNRQRFAGYSDWRVPTIEELASLLQKESEGGVHMASVFDNKQSNCWTVDECDADYNHHLGIWIIDFKQGQVQEATFNKPSWTMNVPGYIKNAMNYVKGVRSAD